MGVFDFDAGPSPSLTQWWNEDLVLSVIRDGSLYTVTDILNKIEILLDRAGTHHYALRTVKEIQDVLDALMIDGRVIADRDRFVYAASLRV